MLMYGLSSDKRNMAIRHLLIAASCVVAVTSTPTGTVDGNGTLHASGSNSCSASTSTPTAVASGNGAFNTSELKSCSASMDGQLPSPTSSDFHFSGNVRRYYIAAEEVEWDYAPTGWDNWLGVRAKDKRIPGSLVLTSP
jgi:hypothetical protein